MSMGLPPAAAMAAELPVAVDIQSPLLQALNERYGGSVSEARVVGDVKWEE